MPRQYTPRVTITCAICGKVFNVPSYRAKTAMYCSLSCRAKRATAERRFWSHVDKGAGPDGCWLWRVSTGTTNGYGQISSDDGKHMGAHVFSWILHYGPVPAGFFVCHSCDDRYPAESTAYRRCVRPDHLFLGTPADNSVDMMAKGRQATGDRHRSRTHPGSIQRGEAHGGVKLTEAVVREIRTRYASESITQKALATEFGIGTSLMHAILSRRLWVHVV